MSPDPITPFAVQFVIAIALLLGIVGIIELIRKRRGK